MTKPTYKLTLLLTVRPDLAPADFVDRWLASEAADPLSVPGLVRHVFDRPLVGDVPVENVSSARYHAAQETWWERKNDAANWFVSHAFESWLSGRLPLLAGRPDAVGGEPQVIWERDRPVDMNRAVTVILLPVAKRSLTQREFAAYWTGHHARLALGGPHTKQRLVRLEDTVAQPTPSPFAKNRYDGVGAVTFESAEALADEFGSDYYRETLAPDEPRFSDPVFSTALLTDPVTLS